MLGLAHDGVYFACPDSRCVIGDFTLLRAKILESRGAEVTLNDIICEKIDIAGHHTPTDWCAILRSPLAGEGSPIRYNWEGRVGGGPRNLRIHIAICNIESSTYIPRRLEDGPMAYRENADLFRVFLRDRQ